MSEEAECSCKFGRMSSKYDLASFERELKQQWQSSDGPGLRTLADRFNREILRTALEDAGERLLKGESENLYRLLTDDDVSAGIYTQARNRLHEQGVDPDSIESAFISYQTVNRHFKNCRDLTKEESNTGSEKRTLKDRIFALKNRTVRVTESTLGQENNVQFEEQNVFVDITVSCEECGTVVPVAEAIEGQSCGCFE